MHRSAIKTARTGALLASSVFLVMVSGCPSVSTMTTAKSIGPGKNEFAFSPTAYGFSAQAVGGGSSASTGIVYGGAVDFMYRHGFSDRFDLGVSLTGFGQLAVDGKINFLDTRRIALAVDPGVGGVFLGVSNVGAGYVEFSVPLLVDIVFSDTVRLTLGPKYIGLYTFATGEGSSASAFTHLVGGVAGLEVQLGRIFRLMPHAGAVTWVNKPSSGSVSVNSVFFASGLACKFIF